MKLLKPEPAENESVAHWRPTALPCTAVGGGVPRFKHRSSTAVDNKCCDMVFLLQYEYHMKYGLETAQRSLSPVHPPRHTGAGLMEERATASFGTRSEPRNGDPLKKATVLEGFR